MELFNATSLKELVSALAPGLIILGVRQWFMACPPPELKDRLLAYGAVSATYYALANPAFSYLRDAWRAPRWPVEALEYAVVPFLIGCASAVGMSHNWWNIWWRVFRLQPIHHAPTAWDYAFNNIDEARYILVTLSDGSRVSGSYARGSFASSSREERDILIGEVWSEDDGRWTPVIPAKSMLVCGRDVRFVEFFRGAAE
jgi:hypothetical protein